jgi:hypothetical protein
MTYWYIPGISTGLYHVHVEMNRLLDGARTLLHAAAIQPAIESACPFQSATTHRSSSPHTFFCSRRPAPQILCQAAAGKSGAGSVLWCGFAGDTAGGGPQVPPGEAP